MKQNEVEEIDARAELILNPETGFGERFDAVMTDILAGRHITQTEPDDPGRFRKPSDNPDETEEF